MGFINLRNFRKFLRRISWVERMISGAQNIPPGTLPDKLDKHHCAPCAGGPSRNRSGSAVRFFQAASLWGAPGKVRVSQVVES